MSDNSDQPLRIDGDEGWVPDRAGQYWERGRGWLQWQYCIICGEKMRHDQLQHCGNQHPERVEDF